MACGLRALRFAETPLEAHGTPKLTELRLHRVLLVWRCRYLDGLALGYLVREARRPAWRESFQRTAIFQKESTRAPGVGSPSMESRAEDLAAKPEFLSHRQRQLHREEAKELAARHAAAWRVYRGVLGPCANRLALDLAASKRGVVHGWWRTMRLAQTAANLASLQRHIATGRLREVLLSELWRLAVKAVQGWRVGCCVESLRDTELDMEIQRDKAKKSVKRVKKQAEKAAHEGQERLELMPQKMQEQLEAMRVTMTQDADRRCRARCARAGVKVLLMLHRRVRTLSAAKAVACWRIRARG